MIAVGRCPVDRSFQILGDRRKLRGTSFPKFHERTVPESLYSWESRKNSSSRLWKSQMKAVVAARTYSSSKVIHRWRGELGFALPQPTVNNFGGDKIMLANNTQFGSIERLSTQGPEDEFRTLTLRRFFGELRSGTLRLVVKEYSEPFACKPKLAETNIYKRFHPARTACQNQKPKL